MKFCGNCGSKLVDGVCTGCAAKSTSAGLDLDALEKSVATLEAISKGVRPAEAKAVKDEKKTARQIVEDVNKQVVSYGDRGESESEEEPPSEHDEEEKAKKAFPPERFERPTPEEEEEEERGPEDEEEEEEEERERPRPLPFKSARGKAAKKSFAENAYENSEPIQKAMDVSDFLTAFVDQFSESLDGLRYDVLKSETEERQYQREYNLALAKAVKELGTLVKSLAESTQALSKQPIAQRKSDVTVVNKSFAGNVGAGTTLTKSQLANKIADLMISGDKSVTPNDVVMAESLGTVRPELRSKLGLPEEGNQQ